MGDAPTPRRRPLRSGVDKLSTPLLFVAMALLGFWTILWGAVIFSKPGAGAVPFAFCYGAGFLTVQCLRELSFRVKKKSSKHLRMRSALSLGAALLVTVAPATFAVAHAKHPARDSLHCADGGPVWSPSADFPESVGSVDTVVNSVVASRIPVTQATLSTLDHAGIANSHNSDAVQHDASLLFQGRELRWTDGEQTVDVQVEDFGSHYNALIFQHDYSEDHCEEGDGTFPTPGIAAGLGLRCTCTGPIVDDRVSFVRGSVRVQVIVWNLRQGSDHQQAVAVASKVASVTTVGTGAQT